MVILLIGLYLGNVFHVVLLFYCFYGIYFGGVLNYIVGFIVVVVILDVLVRVIWVGKGLVMFGIYLFYDDDFS